MSTRGGREALQMRIVFKGDRAHLITRAWDQDQVTMSAPYTLISRQRDVITAQLEGDASETTIYVVAGGRRLRLVQGGRRWWLRRIR